MIISRQEILPPQSKADVCSQKTNNGNCHMRKLATIETILDIQPINEI